MIQKHWVLHMHLLLLLLLLPLNLYHPKIENHINNERQHSLKEDWWNNTGNHIKKLHLKQGFCLALEIIQTSQLNF